MNKMEIKFDEGKISISGNLTEPEILYAAKIMELNVIKDVQQKENTNVKTIITQLETMLLPFGEEIKENFDQEHALKMLPVSLKLLVDYYKKQV